jgi:hypothetical protein
VVEEVEPQDVQQHNIVIEVAVQQGLEAREIFIRVQQQVNLVALGFIQRIVTSRDRPEKTFVPLTRNNRFVFTNFLVVKAVD